MDCGLIVELLQIKRNWRIINFLPKDGNFNHNPPFESFKWKEFPLQEVITWIYTQIKNVIAVEWELLNSSKGNMFLLHQLRINAK